jgi:hypothetical protein
VQSLWKKLSPFFYFYFLAIPPQGPNLNIDRQTGSGLTAAAIDAAARKLSQLLLIVCWVCHYETELTADIVKMRLYLSMS